MSGLLRTTWRWLGGIRLTVFILLLLTADTAVGYLCLNRRAGLFQPLNDLGLLQWAQTYAWHNPGHTAWLFVLFILLSLLALNTFVCTTSRVAALARSRAHFTKAVFVFKLAPHIMHYALIIILAGYLGSYLFSEVYPSRTLTRNSSVTIPGTGISLRLDSTDFRYYEGDRLDYFNGRAIQASARLLLSSGGREWIETIAVNRPIICGSYGLFLKSYAPAYKNSMISRVYIELTIRRDPGVYFYFTGMLLFLLGLVLYLCQRFFLKGEERLGHSR